MISALLLILQLILIAFSVWYLPTRLKPTKWNFFTFLLISTAMWFGYTLLAMFGDGLIGNDVPGMGYLVIGFIATFIGCITYNLRYGDRP